MAVNITKENFEELVLGSDKPVLVDFWAAWCGPCQMLGPVIDEIYEERPDVLVCKVDVDVERELTRAHRVMGIPTVLIVKNGEVVERFMGYKPKEEILALLDK